MPRRPLVVYILASRPRGAIYVGVTNDIGRRVSEHRSGKSAFTRRYWVDRLVLVEIYEYGVDALQREKQIKGWTRARKIALIEEGNPEWDDLLPLEKRDPSLRSG